mmetsp:Transcript_88727/g.177388  ORF Transcript_88727/g.177388 Transcript_88727/m.177388 type:complete len:257 (-) Transcript_88727:1186-1956(-)
MRINDGVTSTTSSELMYSTMESRLISMGGVSVTVLSLPADRMLVSALMRHTFTLRSPGRWWMPMIMSLYTSAFGPTQRLPRSMAPTMPYGVTFPSSCASRLPLSRDSISPAHGLYSLNTESSTAVPRVAVRHAFRRPSTPRVGSRYLMVVVFSGPVEATMSTISPLRFASRSTTAPTYSSGTVASTSSNGSIFLPLLLGSSFKITIGEPIMSSKPSRRIASMSTVKCSCPRPDTMYVSALSGSSSTRRATFRSSSL